MHKQNNTILDLDQLQLSDTKLSNQILIEKHNQEDSLLDELQIYSSRTNASKPQSTSTRTTTNNKPAEDRCESPVIITNGDDSSMLAKLINENKALKEKEKQYHAQIQSLEDENEKFK